MTVLEATPPNPNPLNASGFRFWVKKLPNVDFFVQKAIIPSVSIPTVSAPTPFVDMTLQGDHMDFPELHLTWLVDEDGVTLTEIFNWMQAISYPEDYSQFRELFLKPPYSGDGLTSEALLIILDNKKRANFEYVFKDISPTSLVVDPLEIDVGGVNFVKATASFNYTNYKIQSAKFSVDS